MDAGTELDGRNVLERVQAELDSLGLHEEPVAVVELPDPEPAAEPAPSESPELLDRETLLRVARSLLTATAALEESVGAVKAVVDELVLSLEHQEEDAEEDLTGDSPEDDEDLIPEDDEDSLPEEIPEDVSSQEGDDDAEVQEES